MRTLTAAMVAIVSVIIAGVIMTNLNHIDLLEETSYSHVFCYKEGVFAEPSAKFEVPFGEYDGKVTYIGNPSSWDFFRYLASATADTTTFNKDGYINFMTKRGYEVEWTQK